MNQRIKTIFADAQKLSAAEREELADLLLATIEPNSEIDKVWAEEAERRWNKHVQSGEEVVDAFAAIDEVRERLKRRGGV